MYLLTKTNTHQSIRYLRCRIAEQCKKYVSDQFIDVCETNSGYTLFVVRRKELLTCADD